VNEPLKLKKQMQPQSVKNYRSYMRSHHLGLCNRVDLGTSVGLPGRRQKQILIKTLEADAGHRGRHKIGAVPSKPSSVVPFLIEYVKSDTD